MRLRPHARCEIVQDARTLLRRHFHAVARHILEHPSPAIPRPPDRAVEIAESMTLAADLGDELTVGPFRHARIDLLCGRHLNAHNDNEAGQQTRGFHSKAPFFAMTAASNDQRRRRWGNANPDSADAPEFMRIMAA